MQCIVWPSLMGLPVADFKQWIAADGQSAEFDTDIGGRQAAPLLGRWNGAGDKDDAIGVDLLGRRAAHDQMSMMDRVERAAKEQYSCQISQP